MLGPLMPDTARFALLPVREVMATSPLTVHVDATIGELIGLFERHDVEAFPVVTDDRVLRGIVTKLEVLRAMRPDPELRLPATDHVDRAPVSRLMRRGVVTVESDEPIGVAADLMVETGLRSLPVVQRDGPRRILVGIVSRGDLVRGLRREMSRDNAS